MAYMDKGSAQSNSKFMDLKYFWIKEQLDKGLLRLVYLGTDSMPADFFASTGSSFKKCSYRYLYSLVRTDKLDR